MDTKKIKEEYYAETVDMLKAWPVFQRKFDETWTQGKYREAYLYIHGIIEKERVVLSERYNSIDEQFYWEFIA